MGGEPFAAMQGLLRHRHNHSKFFTSMSSRILEFSLRHSVRRALLIYSGGPLAVSGGVVLN